MRHVRALFTATYTKNSCLAQQCLYLYVALLQTYRCTKLFDSSIGFGERFVAAAICDIQYTTRSEDDRSFACEAFGAWRAGSGGAQVIHESPSKDSSFDMAIVSPPVTPSSRSIASRMAEAWEALRVGGMLVLVVRECNAEQDPAGPWTNEPSMRITDLVSHQHAQFANLVITAWTKPALLKRRLREVHETTQEVEATKRQRLQEE
jgi:hypothetical protein